MSVYRNAASTFVFQLSATLLNSGLNILIARMLGPELLGNYQIFLNSVLFLTLTFSIGTDTALLRATAADTIPMNKIVRAVLSIVLLVTFFSVILVTASAHIRIIEAIHPKDFWIPSKYSTAFFIGIFGWMIFCNAMKVFFTVIVNGKQLFLKLNILQTIVAGMNLLVYGTIIILKNEGILEITFEQFLVINGVFYGLSTLTSLLVYVKEIKVKPASKGLTTEEWKSILKYSGAVYAGILLQYLNYRLCFWFLNSLGTKTQLGIFSQALQLCQMLWILSTAASQVLFPFISTKTPEEGVRYVQVFSRSIFWSTGALAIAGSLLSFLMVPILYGKLYSEVAILVSCMSISFVLWSTSKIVSSYTLRNDKMQWMIEGNFAGILINGIANYFLIPEYGSMGAAWALNISLSFVSFYYFYRFVTFTKTKWSSLFMINKEDIISAVNILRKKA